MTHIDHVYMEVESQEAKSQLQEAREKVSTLGEQLLNWKQKFNVQDHRITDLQHQLDRVSETVSMRFTCVYACVAFGCTVYTLG